jgi:hypothetical protein
MTEPPEDFDKLADLASDNATSALQWTRKRFLLTWFVGALLALATGISLWQANEASNDADDAAALAAEKSDHVVAYMRGEQGITGVPGANGEDGSPGLPGSSGAPGEEGPEGPAGPAGAKGETGAAGPAGQNGATGSPGLTGAQGENGAQGAQGETGTKGDKGSTGNTGDKGETGARGDKGDTGAQGDPGAVGAQGPQGPPGPANIRAAFAVSDSNPNDVKSANAVCPNGTAVISGGYTLQGPASISITVVATQNNGWFVQAQETDPVLTDWSLAVFALCAQQ